MIEQPSENPPPGWYQDPKSPNFLRWWNGGEWSDDIRPVGVAATPELGAEMRPIGDWMTETFRLLINNLGSIFTLSVLLAIPAALSVALGIWFGLRDYVLTIDPENQANAFDLAGEGRPAVALLGTLVYLLFFYTFFLTATRVAMSGRFGPAKRWEEGLSSGVGALPRSLGWTMLAVLIVLVVYTVLVAAVSILTVSLGPLALVVIVVGIPLVAALYGRYVMAFSSPLVAVSGNRSIRRVHQVTKGRAAAVVGRTFVLMLISTTAIFSGSLITGPIAAMGGIEPGDSRASVFNVSDLTGDNLGIFLLSVLMNTVVLAVAGLLWHVGQATMFEDLGGSVDPDLRQVSTEPDQI